MITFKQVSKRYTGGFEALSQVNFSLAKGEMVFLTGHSGAGKSTFLRLAARLEQPSSGQIVINGVTLNNLTKRGVASYRSTIGIVTQTPQLLNDRTVFQNVALPLKLQGFSANLIQERVEEALDKVQLLRYAKRYPESLSTGEQQRVGFARAIVHKPQLLLADEPTGNLDPVMSKDVMRIFENFNQDGISIIVATHDLALIATLRYRIMILQGGKLC